MTTPGKARTRTVIMQHSFFRGSQPRDTAKRPGPAFAIPRTLAAIGLVALILELLIR